MDGDDLSRIAMRLILALLAAIDGEVPKATRVMREVLERQLASATDDGERVELTMAVQIVERITAANPT